MPTNTFTLEEAYGTEPKAEFPELVPAKRSTPGTGGEQFLPGDDDSGNLPKDTGLLNIIKSAAERYNVPEEYGLALAQQESTYNPKAENEIGAKGLYQFIDSTSHALGIDPFDPAQSSDAAMKEFAQQAKKHGIDWAIAHHFAGPNPKEHGPKTKAYVAQVKKRAAAIAAALNLDGPRNTLIGQEIPDAQNPQTLTQAKPGQKFGLDEAYGPVLGAKTQEAGGGSFLENAGNALVDTGKAIFDTIKDRLTNPPVRVKRSPEEVEELVNQAMKDPSWGSRALFDSDESVRARLRKQFEYTDPMSSPESAQTYAGNRDAKALAQQEKFERTKDMPAWQQFLNTLDNPVKLITGQSLPANFASFIAHAPDKERLKYEDFSKHMMRLRIINNPDQFPPEAVEAATAAEKRTQEKQDPTVREQWNALSLIHI